MTQHPAYLVPVRDVPGGGLEALCPACDRWTGVWERQGLLDLHATERGPICTRSRTVITLEGALARDSDLNPEEAGTAAAVWKFLNGCKGPLVSEECHHPACHRAVGKGMRWTLHGWRKTEPPALF